MLRKILAFVCIAVSWYVSGGFTMLAVACHRDSDKAGKSINIAFAVVYAVFGIAWIAAFWVRYLI